jgi:hypothetical protein
LHEHGIGEAEELYDLINQSKILLKKYGQDISGIENNYRELTAIFD